MLVNIPGIRNILSKQIDNLTATSRLKIGSLYGGKLNFKAIISYLQRDAQVKTVKYVSQKFPGAFIKFHSGGTITLFPSGKFNILGCHTEKHIYHLYITFNKLIEEIAEEIQDH